MHKLENVNNAPQAFARLLIQSLSDTPTISLSVDEKLPRRRVGENWVDDSAHRVQSVAYINENGDPVSIEGTVAVDDCVQLNGAFKVVLAVRVANGLKGAFSQGQVSKAYSALELIQVVEVWGSASKRLYSAGEPTKPGSVMSPDGKIEVLAGKRAS